MSSRNFLSETAAHDSASLWRNSQFTRGGGGGVHTGVVGLEMARIRILAVTWATGPKSQIRRHFYRVQSPTLYGFHTLERTKGAPRHLYRPPWGGGGGGSTLGGWALRWPETVFWP